MKKYVIILFFIVIILTTYCRWKNNNYSNSIQSNENTPIVFDLKNLNETSKVKLSELEITDIQYIPLETNNSTLIKDIFLLKLDGNSIYIFDYSKILRFAFDGSFITQIGRRGKGYGEYPLLSDFSIDRNNQNIYVLSPHENKIYIYSSDGKFIKTIPSPTKTMKIYCLDKQIFCYSQNHEGNVENSFDVIDYNGNILKSFPNKYKFEVGKYHGFWKYECLVYLSKGKLFTKEIYTDTILIYNNLFFKPAYVFSNGGKTLPSAERHLNSFNAFIKISQKYKADINLLGFSNYVYYEFSFSGQDYSFIGSTNGGSQFLTKLENGFVNDIDGGSNIWFKTTMDDHTIVSWINPIELKTYIASESFKNSTPKYPEKKKELEKLANSLNENDNPVLMLVKLKE